MSKIKPAELFSVPIALLDDVYQSPQDVLQQAISVATGNKPPDGWLCDIQTSFAAKAAMPFVEQIPQFRDVILQAANQYSQIHWRRDSRILQSWANIASTNQYQEQHQHIVGDVHAKFCGVYYPQVQDGEVITFHCPYPTINMFDDTKSTTSINIKQNRLILFPAYLEHSFRPMIREKDKVSVAFNFILTR